MWGGLLAHGAMAYGPEIGPLAGFIFQKFINPFK
jgi:hypothetical protein